MIITKEKLKPLEFYRKLSSVEQEKINKNFLLYLEKAKKDLGNYACIVDICLKLTYDDCEYFINDPDTRAGYTGLNVFNGISSQLDKILKNSEYSLKYSEYKT
ncbi:hypothetical protein [Candidatus Sulfurimonas baltica]|uniref:Uncharacterized protein n=1 Tax=Candidatus Sulfurimonas baltica TaxID=2740404 RepID=A0A7S7LU98_9BACT|nr:hypothetical protein [Candidatus Sulfurimonas baltica]QOY50943.1 hypothetical protein HUE88_07240 [Candidatus Sulfurimonas baltica]